jgi:transcriptional pleiotropic regulator of transition state genes
MKATGIVRKVDELGRVVIPKETRKVNGWNEFTPLEIYTEGDSIIMRKYQPACIFCDSTEEVTEFMGKKICSNCRKELTK